MRKIELHISLNKANITYNLTCGLGLTYQSALCFKGGSNLKMCHRNNGALMHMEIIDIVAKLHLVYNIPLYVFENEWIQPIDALIEYDTNSPNFRKTFSEPMLIFQPVKTQDFFEPIWIKTYDSDDGTPITYFKGKRLHTIHRTTKDISYDPCYFKIESTGNHEIMKASCFPSNTNQILKN